jgi:dsDNA-binding SOS-regulon protein
MAVEIKYVVIREGEEKMSFASKKEADAYDENARSGRGAE